MQPTIEFSPSAASIEQNSLDVSRANVGFVAGNRALFSDETAALVRSRLSAAALAIALMLVAAFIGNLISQNTSHLWLRGLILLITIVSAVTLRYRCSLSLPQLRVLELIVFGSVLIQLSLMLLSRLIEFSAKNDAVSMASIRQQFLMGWCVLIFIYGTLMPNSWKRAAAIMIPVAILPYLLIAIQCWLSPEVAILMDSDNATSPLPFPLVSAIIATFATHVITSARRSAFKARQFGQYRLGERLGSGGMGEVYKAEHMLLKRPCAIKLIKANSEADASAVARFEKEVKTTAKLTHWNTVEIYDYGRTEDGTFYYVMELLPGMSLEDLVQKHGPLLPARVVYLLRQICGALNEAHSVGLIHRDIKPANIFASQRGGVFDIAKLLDFGLVKEGEEKSDSGTRKGSFSGTPLYMSPEQALAYGQVDGRADIYSLGAVAYYLLTGKTPFASRNVLELLAAHRSLDVTPPTRLNPNIPADVEQIVLKCLAKAAQDRYRDAHELQKDLDHCLCSSQWGPDEAKAWWTALAAKPPEVPQDNPLIAATLDIAVGTNST